MTLEEQYIQMAKNNADLLNVIRKLVYSEPFEAIQLRMRIREILEGKDERDLSKLLDFTNELNKN